MGNKIVVFILALLFMPLVAESQSASADSARQRKNVVRLSLTHPLVFGSDNIILGYERVITPYQTMSINAGLTSLPKLISIDLDSLEITKDSKAKGYNVSLDYRFYLQKENKFRAPHGVYIGPYAYLYTLDRDNEWNIHRNGIVKEFSTVQKLRFYGVGFELGYQFVFWKRMTLDLVLVGPGITRYSYENKIEGELDLGDKQEVADAMKAWIEEKYPGLDIAWGDQEVDVNGRINTTSLGYRYLIHVGFLF
jgi:Protein of unknown function (DUF3575)